MNHPLKKLVRSESLIETLAKKYKTPLYIYDKNQLLTNITSIDNIKTISVSIRYFTL